MDRQERGDRRIGAGQLLEDPHGVEAAQPAAADVLIAVDRRHPKLGGLPQLLDREVMCAVPFQRMRGKPLLGERGRRLGDHAFVVVQAEELQRCSTSSSG